MKQAPKLKTNPWIPTLLSAALLAGIYGGLWYVLPAPVPRHVLFGGVLLLFLTEAAWTLHTSRRILRFSDSVCDALDLLCRDGAAPEPDTRDDGADTRIRESLYRCCRTMQERQNDSVQAKLEIQEILSDISHQVKTPIANVKVYTDILRRHALPEAQRAAYFQLLDGQVDKLDFLLQAMIKLSRLETGAVSLSVAQAPVCDTVLQAMNVVLRKAEDKHIDLSAECPPDLTARHDPKWTAEALGNLLDNAVKYTPEGGGVSVTVRPWQYYVRIDVADTGIGIPEAHYHDIFKRFYRMEDVAQEEGVGIGLYLAREIITCEKGYISVKSRVAHGSVFSVYLVSDPASWSESERKRP